MAESSDNIVRELVKVDFHIHSYDSIKKDGEKVKFNTLENIEILVDNLVENKVDMVSITDHNFFSLDMYDKLKLYEGKKIKKVLPGIEFDVEFEGERIHIITIFSDKNYANISSIPNVLKKSSFDNSQKNAYTEKTFKDILKQIDTNVLLIAHQKSGVRADIQNENLSKIGEELFDSIIGIDYFDALEFRSGKVEGILKDYKEEKNLSNLRYITGTDCHNWSVYPQQYPGDKSDIKFSYLKCLPTFKGLVMALTEPRRVTTARYNLKKPFVNEINLTIDSSPISIKLSHGLNVIIGDNSIGKSLLLDTLIDPTYSNVKQPARKTGYKNYLKRMKIKITPFTADEENKIHYDYQGKIRELFQSGTKLLDIPFFKGKFKQLDNKQVESVVMGYAERVLKKIELNQEKEKIETELNYDIDIPAEVEDKTYLLRITDNLTIKIVDYNLIITRINTITDSLEHLKKTDGFNDKRIINNIINTLKKLKKKYELKKERQDQFQNIISKIKNICKEYEDKNKEKSQSQENLLVEFKQNIISAKDRVINKINENNKEKYEILESFSTININKETNSEGKYNFVTQTLEEKITQKDIVKILTEPLSRVSTIDKIEGLTSREFENKLKQTIKVDGDNYEKNYKDAVRDYLNKKYLKQETNIYLNDKKIPNGNSQGRNAMIYLDVLSDEQTNKLYIVDQPDDDISHLKLKSDVINIMKRMSDNKQVLFITHKPELVVNLDVDNVIILKEEDGRIIVNSGALEYEDEDKKINILKDVAEILDGGEETIRKRWKRYDK